MIKHCYVQDKANLQLMYVALLLTDTIVELSNYRFKDSRSSALMGEPYMFHENGTLEIPVAQAINNGKYTCVARNNLGIAENHVYLEIKGEFCRILESNL